MAWLWLLLNAAAAYGMALWLVRMLRLGREFPLRRRLTLIAGGVFLAVATGYCIRFVYGLAGLGGGGLQQQGISGLLALVLFAVPLEEGAKVLWVRGPGRGTGSSLRAFTPLVAVWVSVGFACARPVLAFSAAAGFDWFARALLNSFAHLFFAALWAVALSERPRRWGGVWLLATLFHALFQHLVDTSQGRTWFLILPVLAPALGVLWLGLKELRRKPVRAISELELSNQRSLLRGPERMPLGWLVGGAFVTTGVVIVFLAMAIFVGHQIGVDFALADEADSRADGPIVLLTAALAGAFPVAGYLIARASGTSSVVEPAISTALAISAVVVLLSVTAPVAVIFAGAVAPLAFALACAGAWFGVAR